MIIGISYEWLIVRTALNVLTAIILLYVVTKDRRPVYLLLMVQTLLNMVVRAGDVAGYVNVYRDFLLTLANVATLAIALDAFGRLPELKYLKKIKESLLKELEDNKHA
jgi:hypothetical protein